MKAFITDIKKVQNKTREELKKMGIEIVTSAIDHKSMIYIKDRKTKDYYILPIIN